MDEMEPKKNFLTKIKNRAILAAGALGLIAAANAGEISAKSNTEEMNSVNEEGKSTIVTPNVWDHGIPRDIEQTTGEDPAGTDIALALTVNGAEIQVTRVPASPELLAQLATVMDLKPDSLVNTLSWDSPDVNMGDVQLFEVIVDGTPKYVVLNPKASDATQKSKTFNTAREAKFSIFKAQINIAEGANLRTGPGTNFSATKYVTRTKEYFTGETLTDGDLTWYKLASGNWVASKGLTGGKLKLIIETNAAVAETGSQSDYPRIPGFDGYFVSSIWKGANPILQEMIDKKHVPTNMLSLEEVKKIGPTGFTMDARTGVPTILTAALVDCTQQDVMYASEEYTVCTFEWVGKNDSLFASLYLVPSAGQMDIAFGDDLPMSVPVSRVKEELHLSSGKLVDINLFADNIGYEPGIKEAYTAAAEDLAAATATGIFTPHDYTNDKRLSGSLGDITQVGSSFAAFYRFRKKIS